MTEKRSFKNPYHQTQSELAEWLVLFAQDYSTAEVADALVDRYPERSSGDPKADRRLAKEAICTVNPNDSRYNAEKWAKQYRLMQANYFEERENRMRQLASKSVSALNATFDNLESTISSLSPKEQISLVPKALLTLSQAVKNVTPPAPQAEPDISEEDAESEERAKTLAELEELTYQLWQETARDMLWEGKNFDEITAGTYVDEEQIKNDLARQWVEDEVIRMIKGGMNREQIRGQTKIPYAYIDYLIDHADDRRTYPFALPEEEPSTDYEETPALSGNGSGEDLAADSDAAPNLN
jgi:hypothetical protein